jgi:hypothetical protein
MSAAVAGTISSVPPLPTRMASLLVKVAALIYRSPPTPTAIWPSLVTVVSSMENFASLTVSEPWLSKLLPE